MIELVHAQEPVIDLTISSPICINEPLSITNNTTDADRYAWDFCHGDLLEKPTSSLVGTLAGTILDIEIVEDNGSWHGFATSYSNTLYRLDFGNSLDNTPTVTNLGNIGGLFNFAYATRIIYEGGNWYGILANRNGHSLIRLSFGTDLTNVPTGETIILDVTLSRPRGLDIAVSGGSVFALVSSQDNLYVTLIDFGNSITNNGSGSTINVSNIQVGIEFFLSDDNWYAYVVSDVIEQIDFGNTISSTPLSVDEVTLDEAITNGTNIEVQRDGEDYYAVLATAAGSVFNVDMGSDLSLTTGTVTNLGSVGNFTSVYGFGGAKFESQYNFFGINLSSDQLYKIVYHKDCGLETETSSDVEPTNRYDASGNYYIYLDAYNNLLPYPMSSIEEITVLTQTTPTIDFTTTNQCITQTNTFIPFSDGTITNFQWEVDEIIEQNGPTAEFTHTLGDLDEHQIKLTIDDGICTNTLLDSIKLYPEPVTPTFSTPGAPYCTGADLAFENLFDESNYNGATLTYDWNYNGEGNTNERDGTFAFDSEGTKTITLTATIPGCSTPSAGTDINVIAGPDVGFSFEDLCLEDETQFHNSTTGTGITGQTWNFGDGSGTSSASSPTYSYAAHGNYDVSLTVNNNQGCSNELTLPITIDDKPVASFNHGPACEGVDISFLDESSVDGLANITSHEWDFEGLGTSTNQNPNFTFDNQGSYDVELVVETTAGCRDTVTSTINVLLAPAANFEVDLGCINTETIFLDKSEGDFSNPITQWIWTIDGSLASYSSSFGEVYNDAGDHTISLLVRSANSCQSVHNDNFTINELPVVDFTVEKACDNESTVFQDATNSSSAAIESYSWQFDNQGSSTSNPATYQFTSAGSYTVGLNIVDETGCEGSIQKTVTIHPSPTAIINASSDIGPAPLMIDFTDESQSTQSSFWLFGDEDESTSSENNPQFTYTDEGDYTAQLISTNDLGCRDTTSLAITVADPILDLELVQISTEESEEKTSVSLTVRNSGNVILHGFDIRIDLDNNSSIFESYAGTITRGKSITYPLNFTFSSVGNNIGYTCITLLDRVEEFEDINIVNNESCIDFNQQLIIENSYPNPVRSTDTKIRFNMILPADGPVQIFLLNATGAVLYQETYMEAKAGLNSFFLDIYSFEQGMYFIKTVYDQNESTQRFVKM
ncbi:PKD domain-containing protein [Reichenbachiella sp.]